MEKISIAEATQKLTAPGAPFEMIEVNVDGVQTRTWKHSANSLRDVFAGMEDFAEREFIVYEGRRVTYEQHNQMVRQLAHVLVNDYGVKKGDRVAIAMRNMPEWSVCFFATVVIGAVAVPLNAWWTGAELEYGLSDSQCSVVFVDQQRAQSLKPHYANLDVNAVVCVGPGAELPKNVVGLGEILSSVAADVKLPDIEIAADDNATIFYTSGTTGKPKGALGTHRNICGCLTSLNYAGARTMLRSGIALPSADQPPKRLRQLMSVPLFHATGCHATLVMHASKGNTLIMMYKWDAEKALELIEREKVTSFGGVPAMAWQLAESPSAQHRDLSSLMTLGYGGAPSAPELQTRIKEVMPNVGTSNGYGLTESSAALTVSAGADYIAKPESVGVPIAIDDVKIMDEDGVEEMLQGEVGEIWARGGNIVRGYWNKPEETAKTFRNGWLVTGDLGFLDEEGFLYIADRAKDMLIRGGENIYCMEVENALYEHPNIMDAAVVGVPDKVLGEEVGAVVQLTPGAELNTQGLRAFLENTLAAFMIPKFLLCLYEPLPRNANGKILKPEAKAQLLQSLESKG